MNTRSYYTSRASESDKQLIIELWRSHHTIPEINRIFRGRLTENQIYKTTYDAKLRGIEKYDKAQLLSLEVQSILNHLAA